MNEEINIYNFGKYKIYFVSSRTYHIDMRIYSSWRILVFGINILGEREKPAVGIRPYSGIVGIRPYSGIVGVYPYSGIVGIRPYSNIVGIRPYSGKVGIRP